MKEPLKNCPIPECGAKANLWSHGFVGCSDPDCPLSECSMPMEMWQSILREKDLDDARADSKESGFNEGYSQGLASGRSSIIQGK